MKTFVHLPVSRLFVVAALLSSAVGALAQAPAGDIKAGQAKAAMCIGCHGIVGYQNSFPEIHKVPKISGQSGAYITAALSAYKKGERKHPSMRGIATSLSDQDMADLGAFYGSHGSATDAPDTPSRGASVEVAALLEKGACIGCHGANFSKPIDPTYPKIAGQHADYLYVALKSYSVEGNHVRGRANAIMGGIATQYKLSELKQMATYLASLEGELKTVPQAKFR
jgi:cytochrome c553